MLRQNLGYKILALLLAIFLWFYVIIVQRNTLETQAFTVPVEMRNLDGDHVASVDPPRVRLFLRGRPDVLESPSPARAAYVDARHVKPGEQMIEVTHVAPGDLRVIRIVPRKVRLTVEPLVSRTMSIEVNVVGAPPPGHILGEPRVAPATVAVSGVRNAIKRVRYVLINVGATYARLDTPQTNALRAVDEDGAPVEDVELKPSTARVTIPVERKLSYQTAPVVVRSAGQPAAGYRIASVGVSPPLVTIAGEAQRLSEITYVQTAAVNLDGAQDDIRRSVPLALPDGVITVADSKVQVSINIEPER